MIKKLQLIKLARYEQLYSVFAKTFDTGLQVISLLHNSDDSDSAALVNNLYKLHNLLNEFKRQVDYVLQTYKTTDIQKPFANLKIASWVVVLILKTVITYLHSKRLLRLIIATTDGSNKWQLPKRKNNNGVCDVLDSIYVIFTTTRLSSNQLAYLVPYLVQIIPESWFEASRVIIANIIQSYAVINSVNC